MIIGYSRVSTTDQSTAVQIEQLNKLGCEKIFEDVESGKSSNRKQLNEIIIDQDIHKFNNRQYNT